MAVNVENIAAPCDFAELPDGVYHELIDLLERCTDQREQVRPSQSFSEREHVIDQTETILELIEDVTYRIGRIVGQEEQRRRHVSVPARSRGVRTLASLDDE